MRIGRFPFQFPLGVQLGIGTQPHYKAPVDHQVKILENALVNIKLVKLSPQEQSKVGHRTTKKQLEKTFYDHNFFINFFIILSDVFDLLE